jgi:uncharacterized protein YcfJ
MSRPKPALEMARMRIELLLRSRVDHHGDVQGVHGMKTMIRTGAAAAAFTALLGAAASAGAAEYATVVSATPVTGSVAAPRRDCVQSEQIVQQPPSGAGALVGAIAGGVIGNQFGHGFGKAAATGLGVVAGSTIGNNVEASANPPTAVPVQHCRTVNGYENRIVGYDVVYEYNGQRYSTRLPHDPGARLAIDVRPVGGAPLGHVAPPANYGAVPPAYPVPPAYADAGPSYGDGPAPVYGDPAPAYPARYYAAAPVYYGAPYYAPYYAPYVAPAIGLGIGYWIGSAWHGGYYHGYYGGHHWH